MPPSFLDDIGGEYHLDIYVFRNNKLFPQWKSYEKISIKDLGVRVLEGNSRGHQEDARRNCVLEFIDFIQKPKPSNLLISELTDHSRGTALLSGIYQSSVKRSQGFNPLINMSF